MSWDPWVAAAGFQETRPKRAGQEVAGRPASGAAQDRQADTRWEGQAGTARQPLTAPQSQARPMLYQLHVQGSNSSISSANKPCGCHAADIQFETKKVEKTIKDAAKRNDMATCKVSSWAVRPERRL